MADLARRTLLAFAALAPLAAHAKPLRPKGSAGFGLAAFGTAPFGQ